MQAQETDKRFGVPGKLTFESGAGGLTLGRADSRVSTGSFYLYGAHIVGYQPAGHEPVLFTSAASAYEQGKAIRGGVPVCFPWFGPHGSDPSAPSHGPARIAMWELTGVEQDAESLSVTLSGSFEPYDVGYRVTFGRDLRMVMAVRNVSDAPAQFECALHTYFAVGDAKRVEITGLEGVDYLDKVDGQKRKNQGDEPIVFEGETDRVYLDTESTCILTDPVLGRRITVGKHGSRSTVVWNPWVGKAKAMADFGDDEWPKMACIETANVGPNAVELEPGGVHEMGVAISVAKL